MNYALRTLRAELERVKASRASYEAAREKMPNQMRPSEWAMTISKYRGRELDLF
jgi:hypothetical protein